MSEMTENMIQCRKRKKQDGSFHVPLDLLINILKKLPVKTLIRFKCVAKDWLKLIESTQFISQHLSHSASSNNTFLLHHVYVNPFWIGPDLKAHHSRFMDFTGVVAGSCNGLLCVRHNNSKELFLCNPATRQVKQVPKSPNHLSLSNRCVRFAFAFSHAVNDYKIVKFFCNGRYDSRVNVPFYHRVIGAEVYSLTTGSWKAINLLHDLPVASNPTIANGAVFWLASEPGFDPHHELFLVSFDITQQVFTKFKGPPQSHPPRPMLYKDKLAVHNNKLAYFRSFDEGNVYFCSFDVWVLEDTCAGNQNWVKKYSVGPFPRLVNPTCFYRDGIVCLQGCEKFLALVNPYTNELKSLPDLDSCFSSALFNYTESLVPIPIGNIDHDQ